MIYFLAIHLQQYLSIDQNCRFFLDAENRLIISYMSTLCALTLSLDHIVCASALTTAHKNITHHTT